MSQARLMVNEMSALVVGAAIRLPVRRVHAWVYFGNERAMQRAVIDTGCPVCTLPKRVWAVLDARGDANWLADPPALVPAYQLKRTTAVLGRMYPYRIARVRIVIADAHDKDIRLTPRDVLALCAEEPLSQGAGHEPLPPILGLAELLNGRSLLLDVSASDRWLATMSEP